MASELAIILTAPRVTSLPGNASALIKSGTNGDIAVIEFVKDVQGIFYGLCRIPDDFGTVTTAIVEVSIRANATTGVTSFQISTGFSANAETTDPTFIDITRQDVTVPGTAYLRKKLTFTIATVPVAGDDVIFKFFHDGTQTADTLAVNTEMLMNPILRIT